jgi:hypothetical protein
MIQTIRKKIENCLQRMIKRVIRSTFYEKVRTKFLKKKVLNYFKKDLNQDQIDSEKKEALLFLENNPLSMYPYVFSKKYKPDSFQVFTDNECGMKYVLHENKRLYFIPSWTEKQVRKYYHLSLIEQDLDSPHRYEYEDFKVSAGDVVVDVGVAEGNFALSVVERAKKIYLFETDEHWIYALKKTFEQWQDKVIIVNKFVSDNNTDNEVCLDDYFKDTAINFLKADVEGSEMQVLRGAQNILSKQKKLQIAICTYHKQHDADEINNFLKANRFLTTLSKRYMICWWDRKLTAPWFRRGLIRAVSP